jgi:3-dehydroquinate dehydratase type I
MICVSISDKIKDNCLQLLENVEMAEIRLDLTAFSEKDIDEVFKHPTPKIATCRFENTSLEEQHSSLKRAIEAGAQYIDIEIEVPEKHMLELISIARRNSCKTIISYHNFTETPGLKELFSIAGKCYELGADIAKIASMVNKAEDNSRLMALYDIGKPIVSLGMGELGKATRMIALMLGAEFSFASPDDGNETAPGQIKYKEMKELFEHINQVIK